MPIKVVIQQHLVNEPNITRPIIFGLRLAKGNIEGEVVKLTLDRSEIFLIEDFTLRSSAVPEADLTRGLLGMEQIKNVAPHGGHPRTTTDEHDFPLGLLHEELAVGAADHHLIARLEIKDV